MPRPKSFDQDLVLEKAMELFWEKGYQATSIQDLVDQLGINRASLYDTFGGKEALFEQAFAKYRQGSEAMVRSCLQEANSFKVGLEQLFLQGISDVLQGNACRGCLVVNTTTEQLPGNNSILKILAANREGFITFFKEEIQRAIARGEISSQKDPASLASFIFTFYNGLQVVSKTQPPVEELKASIQEGLSVLD